MPYKKEISRKKKMSPVILAYLTDGEVETKVDADNLWCFRHGMTGFFEHELSPKELWKKYRADFLLQFIEKHPGRRPLAWWQWDAPRQPDHGSGCWFEGTLPEPRKRISGKGDLHNGYMPSYQYGIPTHWDSKSLDPDDPLIFESETAYLSRHDLLSAKEKKYLASHPELMEPEMIIEA